MPYRAYQVIIAYPETCPLSEIAPQRPYHWGVTPGQCTISSDLTAPQGDKHPQNYHNTPDLQTLFTISTIKGTNKPTPG